MARDPKQEKFLHSLPPAPGMKPPAASVAPMARPQVAPIAPGIMPVPGQKAVRPPRWNRLQAYLNKPAAPIAPPKEEEPQ